MLPLALIVRAKGATVDGSDRSLDQGRIADKFDFLQRPRHRPASRRTAAASPAPTRSWSPRPRSRTPCPTCRPRARSARRMMRRAELLAELFNAAPAGIGVAGTSGKSTITGMIGWILHATGPRSDGHERRGDEELRHARHPVRQRAGRAAAMFVSRGRRERRLDRPATTRRSPCVNNISLDHKIDGRAARAVRRFRRARRDRGAQPRQRRDRGAGGSRCRRKARHLQPHRSQARDYLGRTILEPAPDGIAFDVSERATARAATVRLHVPGRHNVANALAALGAARACGVVTAEAAAALDGFAGIAAAGGGRHGERRHRHRRLRPQPRQDRRHPEDPARLPRPPAGDVPAARLRPAEADETRVHRRLRATTAPTTTC